MALPIAGKEALSMHKGTMKKMMRFLNKDDIIDPKWSKDEFIEIEVRK